MKFYVAGKFEKKELILEIYRKLKKLGHEVSYDWTTHKKIKPYDKNKKLASTYSENELKGISNSEVFVYLTDEKGTTLPMEFGAALMSNKLSKKPLVYAIGEFNNKSPWFFNNSVKRKSSIDEFFEELIENPLFFTL